jgi:hypothetical protein
VSQLFRGLFAGRHVRASRKARDRPVLHSETCHHRAVIGNFEELLLRNCQLTLTQSAPLYALSLVVETNNSPDSL